MCYLHLWIENRGGAKNQHKDNLLQQRIIHFDPHHFYHSGLYYSYYAWDFNFCETRDATNTVSFLGFSWAVVKGLLGIPSRP